MTTAEHRAWKYLTPRATAQQTDAPWATRTATACLLAGTSGEQGGPEADLGRPGNAGRGQIPRRGSILSQPRN